MNEGLQAADGSSTLPFCGAGLSPPYPGLWVSISAYGEGERSSEPLGSCWAKGGPQDPRSSKDEGGMYGCRIAHLCPSPTNASALAKAGNSAPSPRHSSALPVLLTWVTPQERLALLLDKCLPTQQGQARGWCSAGWRRRLEAPTQFPSRPNAWGGQLSS